MSYYGNIREEEIKNKVAQDWFANYDTTQILGNIDFCVAVLGDDIGLCETESLLWAESKRGTSHDIYESFVQLILTIGKERTFDHHLPPMFLGAFDANQIAFLPYNTVLDSFYQNDFNWNVTPSDHETKEFRQLYTLVRDTVEQGVVRFRFSEEANDLSLFIRKNFVVGRSDIARIRINKNNFTHIYQRWLQSVKPTIAGIDWEKAKERGIIDADFFLADILSEDNLTKKEKLYVLLCGDHYELDRKIDEDGFFSKREAMFSDNQAAHTQFWNRYSRPPRREYWDYIVGRRDLLVPADIRERRGSFFTPRRWVELSQEYLARELGENWQDEYYIWDCCAGTGNLLAGLTNARRIWASTLDQADVQVMHDSIESGGANLFHDHVFQFDFLNDSFEQLPKELKEILKTPEKLIIYINPPYAEAGSATQVTGKGENKTGVSNTSKIWEDNRTKFGLGIRELYAQFFIRIYDEIPTCILAEFSTLKILQGSAFKDFRQYFRAKLGRNFIVPASSFDNVDGKFPIGFFIWHTAQKEVFSHTITDVYNQSGAYVGRKTLCAEGVAITKWISSYILKNPDNVIGYTGNNGPDYQNNQYLHISSVQKKNTNGNKSNDTKYSITTRNLIPISIYFSVRLFSESTWLNDRDQFLFPNDNWKLDFGFQADCVAYTLFHGQNRISASHGTNHWIPFTEQEVGSKYGFESHFMSDFLRTPIAQLSIKPQQPDIFGQPGFPGQIPENGKDGATGTSLTSLQCMSQEAQAVMEAGRKLWQYYHAQPQANPNAAFYDIRLFFQGTKTMPSGKTQMKTDSDDVEYTRLISELRQRLKALANHIAPKVYEYGFLLK